MGASPPLPLVLTKLITAIVSDQDETVSQAKNPDWNWHGAKRRANSNLGFQTDMRLVLWRAAQQSQQQTQPHLHGVVKAAWF